MTIQLIGIFALALGFASFWAKPEFVVYILVCSTLLGAAAAFVLDSLGSTNISPSHLLLGFLTIRLLAERGYSKRMWESLDIGKPAFWFGLTVLYSLLSAYFFPRLFEGATNTFGVRSYVSYPPPLTPTTSNLTQSIYFIGDLVCFVVLYAFASKASGKLTLANAALACATLNLFFAALDLATYFTGTAELLSFIRNANYSMLNDTELAGFKRIVGSFVEASSFGASTLGYFAFSLRLWLLGIRPYFTFTLAALSLITLVFSTSTTAYVGLAVFVALVYSEIFVRALRSNATPQMIFFLIATPFLAAITGVAIAMNDSASAYVGNILDTIVFSKMTTASGLERSSWNQQAIQNFIDTYGLGVGNGSVRASSFPVGVIASLGFIGAVLFSIFFASLFFGNRGMTSSDPFEQASIEGAKSICVAWLITATVSGALIDLGMAFFAFAALACAPIAHPTRHYESISKQVPQRPSSV